MDMPLTQVMQLRSNRKSRMRGIGTPNAQSRIAGRILPDRARVGAALGAIAARRRDGAARGVRRVAG